MESDITDNDYLHFYLKFEFTIQKLWVLNLIIHNQSIIYSNSLFIDICIFICRYTYISIYVSKYNESLVDSEDEIRMYKTFEFFMYVYYKFIILFIKLSVYKNELFFSDLHSSISSSNLTLYETSQKEFCFSL